jgi:aspartyl-tRNA(Asn)/glutamyl-tRNA(Gln) amidotransferase subunit C
VEFPFPAILILREVRKLNVSKKEVEHVTTLARLALTEEEKTLYTEQFNVILEYIHRLNELKLDDIEPTTHVQQLKNVLREDQARNSEKELLKKVLEEAPDKEKGYFLVPPVIE